MNWIKWRKISEKEKPSKKTGKKPRKEAKKKKRRKTLQTSYHITHNAIYRLHIHLDCRITSNGTVLVVQLIVIRTFTLLHYNSQCRDVAVKLYSGYKKDKLLAWIVVSISVCVFATYFFSLSVLCLVWFGLVWFWCTFDFFFGGNFHLVLSPFLIRMCQNRALYKVTWLH